MWNGSLHTALTVMEGLGGEQFNERLRSSKVLGMFRNRDKPQANAVTMKREKDNNELRHEGEVLE